MYFNITSSSNSVVILLSPDLPGGSGGGGGSATLQHAGSVTHPFITQTYRCVAAYETKDAKNRPFKVAVDEKLDVLIKDPAGQCCSSHASFNLNILHPCEPCSKCTSSSLQVGGWWKTRKSVWLGFLLPTWSYGRKRKRMMPDFSSEV